MVFVRPNKAGTMRHLTVLISTQQCFLHTQTRSRLINPPCCWHTCTLTETQPLNLLFITTNNRFMNALKWHTNMDRLAATKFIYNVQVPPWAPIRLSVPYLHVLTEVQSVFSCSQQRVQHSLLHLLPLNQHRLPMVLFSQQERLNKRRWEASLQSYSSVQTETV